MAAKQKPDTDQERQYLGQLAEFCADEEERKYHQRLWKALVSHCGMGAQRATRATIGNLLGYRFCVTFFPEVVQAIREEFPELFLVRGPAHTCSRP